MNLDKLWIVDPYTGHKSVSLTILAISFIATLIAGALHMAGTVASTSIFTEMMYSACALYFGRKLNINNKNFSSEKAEQVEKKVE